MSKAPEAVVEEERRKRRIILKSKRAVERRIEELKEI